MRSKCIASVVVLLLCAVSAQGVPFSEIRIGDIDGFGFGTGAGLGFSAASGGPINVDGVGVLGNGDFLPDIGGNGDVQINTGAAGQDFDEFDNRSVAEIGGTSVAGTGFTDVATTGSDFTDISLSTSYGDASAANQVYDANTNTFGAGGPFPTPPSSTLPNQPGFLFDFTVDKADLADGTPLFFNLVFGDYDVVPAMVDITTVGGVMMSLAVNTQPLGQDGLIQATFTPLNFSDVFMDGGAVWIGRLGVDFIANNEPYTAFDYVEISVRQIGAVPEPATLAMGGLALATLGACARRRRR